MSIKVKKINKSFGEKRVLRDFSLEAADGERICLLGPSGGGKTTLLNIIAGLVQPDSGEVERPAGKTAYVFQEYRLLPWLTAEDNLIETTGCTKASARELLRAMELGNEVRGYPDDFSGGMKQRLSIARALSYDAEVILLDEPFKGLDPGLRERVIAQVDQYSAGKTVILVTHDPAEADMLHCTRTIQLEG